MTLSTRCAAGCDMRRAPHDGQNPRRLQLNASSHAPRPSRSEGCLPTCAFRCGPRSGARVRIGSFRATRSGPRMSLQLRTAPSGRFRAFDAPALALHATACPSDRDLQRGLGRAQTPTACTARRSFPTAMRVGVVRKREAPKNEDPFDNSCERSLIPDDPARAHREHPQGIRLPEPPLRAERTARSGPGGGRRLGLSSGSAGIPCREFRLGGGLAGSPALRIPGRCPLARVRLWPQRGLSARPSWQRRPFEVSHRRVREPGRFHRRPRDPRPAPLHAADARSSDPICTRSACISG